MCASIVNIKPQFLMPLVPYGNVDVHVKFALLTVIIPNLHFIHVISLLAGAVAGSISKNVEAVNASQLTPSNTGDCRTDICTESLHINHSFPLSINLIGPRKKDADSGLLNSALTIAQRKNSKGGFHSTSYLGTAYRIHKTQSRRKTHYGPLGFH